MFEKTSKHHASSIRLNYHSTTPYMLRSLYSPLGMYLAHYPHHMSAGLLCVRSVRRRTMIGD